MPPPLLLVLVLLGSVFGANKQDKNAQAQRDWQEKMYLMDRDYNTAVNQT